MTSTNATSINTLYCLTPSKETITTNVNALIAYLQERATECPDLIHDELHHYGGKLFHALTMQYRELYKQAKADPIETPELPAPYTQQQQQLEQQIHSQFEKLATVPVRQVCMLATAFEGYDLDEEFWVGETNDGQVVNIHIQ